jgi:hypothetical protein
MRLDTLCDVSWRYAFPDLHDVVDVADGQFVLFTSPACRH